MTRTNVKLAFIANDSSRKATFKKRKNGLMKKVKELSTLCGITACAIIYSPYDSNPEVWPSNSGVQMVVSDFRTLPEMDQHKKMVDQETFLRQRITKASEHLKKQKKDNRELKMAEVMFQCLVGNMGMFHLNIIDLNDLGYLIEQYLNKINRKIEILGNAGMEMGDAVAALSSEGIGSLASAIATTAPAATILELGSSSSSAAAATFFNPMQQQHHHHQQQFRHPAVPHVGFYKQTRNLNLNLNQNHNQNQQQLFMEMMNHPEKMSYEAEHKGFPFMDDNHRNHHQYQQIPRDYSTAPYHPRYQSKSYQ